MAETDSLIIDTSALFAILSTKDNFHTKATSVYQDLEQTELTLWSTSYAMVETVALLHRRGGFSAVLAFEDWTKNTDLQVVWVDERLHDAAWTRFIESEGRGLSLVDWTIAIASQELGAHVFTFDTDFAQQGVAVIPR